MSFSLLRNLGLGVLVLLFFAEVFYQASTKSDDLQRLQQIVRAQLPAHEALMFSRLHIAAAQHQFDRYDQRDRTSAEEIDNALVVLRNTLSGASAPGRDRMLRATQRFAALFGIYLDEERVDPVGDAANEVRPKVIQAVQDLVALASGGEHDANAGISDPPVVRSRIAQEMGRLETDVLAYVTRRHYQPEPVIEQLKLAQGDLKRISPELFASAAGEKLQRLRYEVDTVLARYYAYLDDERWGVGSESFSASRNSLYTGWNGLEESLVETFHVLEKELRDSQQHLLQTAEAAQNRAYVFAAFGGVLAIALSVGLGRALTSRLQVLNRAAHEFGEGRLDYRIKVAQRDELGVLAETLNRMAAQLQAHTEALEKSRAEAMEANRAKSDFLAKMSHEIRTPMNGVLGMSELLSQEPLSQQQRKKLDMITRSGKILLRVIDDILDFSRIESAQVVLEPAPLDLEQMLDDLRDMFADQARSKGLDFRVYLAPDVPRSRQGDAMRLAQILVNLVGNAVKFTEHGFVRLMVSRAAEDEQGLSFAVEDTGVGIEPEVLPKLFQPFQQADNSTSRRFGGTGLGLVIASQLAKLMGGRIMVESTPGQGSRFELVLSLPILERLRRPTPVLAQQARPVRISRSGGEQPRVLVVEDTTFNRDLVLAMLETLGCEVSFVEDGEEALARIANQSFDLVLMDCHMPGMNGIDATLAIRQMEASRGDDATPIVALTADVLPANEQACLQAGMQEFLRKPLSMTALREVLQRYVKGCSGGGPEARDSA